MIAEFGVFFLILAGFSALFLMLTPVVGIYRNNAALIGSARFYTLMQCLWVGMAYFCLTLCFYNDDFSVRYVLGNSSTQLPLFYKLCAVWGGHEGSMMLWVAILSFWMLLVCRFSSSLGATMQARVMSVLGGLSLGFILFLLTTSNPFLRQFELLDTLGRDLNPLLQDPGFLFHPPMLYMGYVGLAVPFALAIASLWEGSIESAWTKWARPWTLAAWCCLTAGITLGSWWAYRELGWGGWWFWDPVENASFMPWLVATALIHSLAVTEQRQQFKAWTMLLAITAFSLSLIGTFLVRSGVLTSVHAFAVDPSRGLYILIFLLIVIGGSLLLFMLRAQTLTSSQPPKPVSRDSALLLNNVFLVVITLTVLLGTVYPLLIEGLGLGKLSVGAPYFNTVFVPLSLPVLFLMGLGVHLKWQSDQLLALWKRLNATVFVCLTAPAMLIYLCTSHFDSQAYIGLVMAFWIVLTSLKALQMKVQQRSFYDIGQAWWGMMVAHLGVAVSVIGIAISTGYGVSDDVRLAPGDSATLAGYAFKFVDQKDIEGPNYTGTQAAFRISSGDQMRIIFPEKRIYNIGKMAMTESAIDVNPFRDIYVALGEPLDGQSWSVRIYFKPLVRWIWAGGFLILAGGFLALTDRRYYLRSKSRIEPQEVMA